MIFAGAADSRCKAMPCGCPRWTESAQCITGRAHAPEEVGLSSLLRVMALKWTTRMARHTDVTDAVKSFSSKSRKNSSGRRCTRDRVRAHRSTNTPNSVRRGQDPPRHCGHWQCRWGFQRVDGPWTELSSVGTPYWAVPVSSRQALCLCCHGVAPNPPFSPISTPPPWRQKFHIIPPPPFASELNNTKDARCWEPGHTHLLEGQLLQQEEGLELELAEGLGWKNATMVVCFMCVAGGSLLGYRQ